jgi:hypothetical protein
MGCRLVAAKARHSKTLKSYNLAREAVGCNAGLGAP